MLAAKVPDASKLRAGRLRARQTKAILRQLFAS